jgi:hypothetical protein
MIPDHPISINFGYNSFALTLNQAKELKEELTKVINDIEKK